jgi:cytochrome P450
VNRVAAAIRGFRDPVGLVVGAGRRGGDLAELTGGRSPTFVVTSPDLAREVLEQQADVFLKGAGSKGLARVLGEGLQVSEGEHHRRERALLDPVFAPERLLPYADTVNRALARAPWDDGRILDVVPEMRAITTAAVLRAMFADATDADVDRLTGAITDLAAGLWHAVVPASASLERTPLPGFRRFRRARETLDGYIEGAIAGRRADRGPPADLLAAMLAAGAPGEGMSDGDARDEVISLLLAGRGTITAALAWTWFLLARHPEVERRLHDELDGALGDRPPEAADVERLGYTRAVWDEALRVYPPAWVLRRKAVRDARLGRRAIPAGSTVLVSVFGIHHDPRFHRDPETFDPARFQGGAGPAPFTYLPFGGGPRGCIGFHFATMEAVLLIAGIASRWRLKLADADWRPEFARSITLRPKRPLRMRLVRR